jgi:NTE family protein
MKDIALALASGGARGLAHIGVIEALEERGYSIVAIAGTSMGAVVGGIYAAGNLPAFKEWMLNLDQNKVYNLIDLTLSAQGFIKGDRVFQEIKSFCGTPNIEQLRIPFTAVAADVTNKEKVIFQTGDLFHAIRASVAIPSMLTPVKEGQRLLVDGGVMDPIPLSSLPNLKNTLTMAVDLNADLPPQFTPHTKPSAQLSGWNRLLDRALNSIGKENGMSVFDLVNHSFDLMQQTLSEHILDKHKPDLLVRLSKRNCETFAFHLTAELIDVGRRLTFETLDQFENS